MPGLQVRLIPIFDMKIVSYLIETRHFHFNYLIGRFASIQDLL